MRITINKYSDINPAFEKLCEETVHNPPFSTDSLFGCKSKKKTWKSWKTFSLAT